VAGFLRWLAINQIMENWDSYPCIPHNYYLYADPADGGRLRWIPWDLNEAMLHRAGHCMPPQLPESVLLDEVDLRRPLIRLLLDDEVYREAYRAELDSALSGAFEENWVKSTAERYHRLIAPYVAGADGEKAPYAFLRDADEFEHSLTGPEGTPLFLHVEARCRLVRDILDR
jgi:spore coat protein H